LLVHYQADDTATFEAELADAVNRLLRDPERAKAMGLAGRARAVTEFGWDTAARKTMAIYESVL
jgi:starch synthase